MVKRKVLCDITNQGNVRKQKRTKLENSSSTVQKLPESENAQSCEDPQKTTESQATISDHIQPVELIDETTGDSFDSRSSNAVGEAQVQGIDPAQLQIVSNVNVNDTCTPNSSNSTTPREKRGIKHTRQTLRNRSIEHYHQCMSNLPRALWSHNFDKLTTTLQNCNELIIESQLRDFELDNYANHEWMDANFAGFSPVAEDFIANLQQRELMIRSDTYSNKQFINYHVFQQYITPEARAILINNLIKRSTSIKHTTSAVLHLAVDLFDRYLSRVTIAAIRLQQQQQQLHLSDPIQQQKLQQEIEDYILTISGARLILFSAFTLAYKHETRYDIAFTSLKIVLRTQYFAEYESYIDAALRATKTQLPQPHQQHHHEEDGQLQQGFMDDEEEIESIAMGAVLLHSESLLTEALHWDFHYPTIHTFFHSYTHLLLPIINCDIDIVTRICKLGDCLCTRLLLDYEYIYFYQNNNENNNNTVITHSFIAMTVLLMVIDYIVQENILWNDQLLMIAGLLGMHTTDTASTIHSLAIVSELIHAVQKVLVNEVKHRTMIASRCFAEETSKALPDLGANQVLHLAYERMLEKSSPINTNTTATNGIDEYERQLAPLVASFAVQYLIRDINQQQLQQEQKPSTTSSTSSSSSLASSSTTANKTQLPTFERLLPAYYVDFLFKSCKKFSNRSIVAINGVYCRYGMTTYNQLVIAAPLLCKYCPK